jgi:MYXO-CTERM domain-containing protein
MLRLVGEAYDPLSTRDSGTARVDSGTARDSGGAADDAGAVEGDGGEVLYEQPAEGCGCRAAGSTPAGSRWWALGLGALALLRRRRREDPTR